MDAQKILNWTIVAVVAFVVLGVTVPIMLLAWGNLTAAFTGTVLASLFGSTIGQILIGGGVIYLAYNLVKMKK